MGTRSFFNGNMGKADSNLLHELTNENIQIHGIDVVYVPRTANNIDPVFEEDTTASFNTSYNIEMYLKSTEGFEGEGDYLSKFGVEIRDRVTFTVARRAWAQHVTRYDSALVRPREGDLVYFPQNKKLFEVRFVEHESMFYPLGDLYVFDLQCELFEYSNEPIDTGIPEIDIIEDNNTTDIFKHAILTEDGAPLLAEDGSYVTQESFDPGTIQDPGADNNSIQAAADDIIDFTTRDPFSERGTY